MAEMKISMRGLIDLMRNMTKQARNSGKDRVDVRCDLLELVLIQAEANMNEEKP